MLVKKQIYRGWACSRVWKKFTWGSGGASERLPPCVIVVGLMADHSEWLYLLQLCNVSGKCSLAADGRYQNLGSFCLTGLLPLSEWCWEEVEYCSLPLLQGFLSEDQFAVHQWWKWQDCSPSSWLCKWPNDNYLPCKTQYWESQVIWGTSFSISSHRGSFGSFCGRPSLTSSSMLLLAFQSGPGSFAICKGFSVEKPFHSPSQLSFGSKG